MRIGIFDIIFSGDKKAGLVGVSKRSNATLDHQIRKSCAVLPHIHFLIFGLIARKNRSTPVEAN